MKLLILGFFLLLSITSIAQEETKIITSRKDFPLQAVIGLDTPPVLYAGQEYAFCATSSGNFDLVVTTHNAKLKLIESSKKGTGGLVYILTPIDTGECTISVGNQTAERHFSLVKYHYSVINYPVPPLHLNNINSGQIITNLDDLTTIECSYSKETGVFDTYEIKSWEASIGNKTFNGKGNMLSKEMIDFVNQTPYEFLHLKVELDENKTGHSISEGVFMIRQDKKEK